MATYRNTRHLQPWDRFSRYHEDFYTFVAANWTITTTEAGANSATEALSTTDRGGVLVVTNDDADNDADFFQLNGEPFRFVAGKKFSFRIRFSVNDATESDLVFGLQITDTTPLAVSDGIFVRKDDGDRNLDFVVVKDSTSSTLTAAAQISDNTWHELEIYYDGTDDIALFVDRQRVGALPITNAPDDENLTISFGIQNGEAAAKVLKVDYVALESER